MELYGKCDNDDDGNKGTRINYVMPYGNYGYKDEITGAGWEANRTNIEDSTRSRTFPKLSQPKISACHTNSKSKPTLVA